MHNQLVLFKWALCFALPPAPINCGLHHTMAFPEFKRYRDTPFAIFDSGAPVDSLDYTTLILVHGIASNSGSFLRLLPLGTANNTRFVLLNRRDYRGSLPIPEDEVRALSIADASGDDAHAQSVVIDYMRRRGRELFDFLCTFASSERIPVVQRHAPPGRTSAVAKGGIVLVGWSSGGIWATNLLANISRYASEEVNLQKYIARFVLYDTPHRFLGYEPATPDDHYNPVYDPDIPPAQKVQAFRMYASAYYNHGTVPGVFEDRYALEEPRPSVLNFTPEETAYVQDGSPMQPGGSEITIVDLGNKYRVFEMLKNDMLYTNDQSGEGRQGDLEISDWNDLEVLVLWGERSVWQMPKAAWELEKELKEGRLGGKLMRKVEVVKVPGGNHFFHWDRPEEAVRMFLTMHDNDPETLEREKHRNLSGQHDKKSSPHDHAPGWNESLASASEAFVKADKSPRSAADMQNETVSHFKARTEEESTTSSAKDEVKGPLSGARGSNANEEVIAKKRTVIHERDFPNAIEIEIESDQWMTPSEADVKADRGEFPTSAKHD
ncbi:hypothetical protein D9619_004290 [Psilocybe cf. subviscida]|uniref:AB hydrolase-1 domain-containing protein n=1 Tax=Psilocybe cf. subviscida TaxID=2480587 RepID=A0A8H5BRD9_9AGAR|nr:hypothetical protein D9619_004290 [Psilocybe cf. subviscida]